METVFMNPKTKYKNDYKERYDFLFEWVPKNVNKWKKFKNELESYTVDRRAGYRW